MLSKTALPGRGGADFHDEAKSADASRDGVAGIS